MDSQSLTNRIRVAEVGTIALTALAQFLWISETNTGDSLHPYSFGLLLLSAGVSFLSAPKSALARQASLYLQALIYGAALALGAYRFYGLLFLILAGKASVQLRKRADAIFVVALFAIHMVGQLIAVQLYKSGAHILIGTAEGHRFFNLTFFEGQVFFCATIVMVSMFGRTFLSEQESRRAAEKLSKEVETLAISIERGRIARDIHDGLGHSLTSLNIQLELTDKLLRKNEIEEAKHSLSDSRDIASSALKIVRKSLQPTNSSDFSLTEAVSEIAARIGKQQNIAFNIEVDEQGLSPASRDSLLFVLKECLTNVQKHSEASTVDIVLKPASGKAKLILHDNGKGFAAQEHTLGFGLKGMEERVNSLGGTLKIESASGKGTNIMVEIPC